MLQMTQNIRLHRINDTKREAAKLEVERPQVSGEQVPELPELVAVEPEQIEARGDAEWSFNLDEDKSDSDWGDRDDWNGPDGGHIPAQEEARVPFEEPPRIRIEDDDLRGGDPDSPDAVIYQPAHATPDIILIPDNQVLRDGDSDDEDVSIIPKAFNESSAVRMAYLQAVHGNVFDGLTVKAADRALDGSLNMLAAAGVLPSHPKPVRTVKSAHCRLGLDPDQYIVQNPVCTICWKIHGMDVIKTMRNASCMVLWCKGIIFYEKTNADGIIKWVPAKILPRVSLIRELRKMLMRPGFAESLRDSRNDRSNLNDDANFPMEDIYHGSIWHKSFTNSRREVGDDFSVRDVPQGDHPVNLTSHRFGLHLTANIDWCVRFLLYI